jgi:hypothetical protein
MTMDFTTPKLVKITMLDYFDKIIKLWDKACSELGDGYKVVSVHKRIATAAPDDLFKVNEDTVKLEQPFAKAFHNITAKAILSLRGLDPTYP